MACVLIQPSHHLFVTLGRIVDGIGYSIELAHMTAILGYGSN
jgi:hypothetical protein